MSILTSSTTVASFAGPATAGVEASAPVALVETLSGAPIIALFVVVAALLFAGGYKFTERLELGQAHAIGAGISLAGFAFLLLIVAQLLWKVV